MNKIGAVLNKNSGTLTQDQKSERINIIRKYLLGRVAPECLAVVQGSEIMRQMKYMVHEQSVDILIAGGGDGTISAAANVLAETNTALMVLPLGTKNNFAADLGISADPLKILSALEHEPNIEVVDTGMVNGHRFVNNATIGVYPKLVREREEKSKEMGWQKWRAKIVASLIVLQRLPLMRVTVESKDFRTELFTPFLFVGNNEYMETLDKGYTRSKLNRGKLWLCMLKSPRLWSLYAMAFELSLRGVREAEKLDTRLLEKVTVNPRRNTVTIAVDGENMRMNSPLQFEIRKKSLRVITG
ncbi:diacylglycerol/lipid kinase family protein [Rhodohalobacter sp. 8-1]|uniref:diacylglycerol/lipid kinase family protein n=1 Tax=Rhodohalobacter sp. 8-1 TaxID=3131972 RepID=UPI0030ECEE91